MPLDPTAPVAVAPAPDTVAEPSPAPDPGPTEDATPAAESPSEGEQPSETPTPESEDPAEDDGDTEGDDPAQTDEERKLSRRERQRIREQERIDKAVEERIAAREREREQAEAEKTRQAQTQEARAAAAKEFAAYIGEDGETDRLTNEIAELNRQIRSEVADPQGVDLDHPETGLLAEVAKKEARLAEIKRAQGFQEKIANNLWNGIEAHVMSPLQFPEFANDPAAQARFVGAEGGIAGALKVAREVIRAAVVAEKDAEIEGLRKTHTSEKAALEADRNSWRVRAGGSEVADTSAGGAAALSGAMSRAEFMALPKERKDQIRRDQPALVAEIYSRSA